MIWAIQFSSTTPRGVGATLVVARHPGRHKACPYHKRPLPSLWDKADLRNRDNSIGKLNSPAGSDETLPLAIPKEHEMLSTFAC